MWVAVFEPLQPDDVGVVVRQPHFVRRRVPVEAEHEILTHGEPRKHRALLRDQNASGVRLETRRPVDDHRACVRVDESRQQIQQG